MNSATPKLCIFLGRHENIHSGMWVYSESMLRAFFSDCERCRAYSPILIRFGGGGRQKEILLELLKELPSDISNRVSLQPLPFQGALRRVGVFFDIFASTKNASLVYATANYIPIFVPGSKILTIHDLLQAFPVPDKCNLYVTFRSLMYRFFFRSMIHSASLIVTDSDRVANDVKNRFHVPGIVKKILPGLNDQFYGDIARERKKERFFIAFCSADPRKRLDLVLNAFSSLVAQDPGIRLKVVASGKAAVDMASSNIEALRLGASVEILRELSTGELIELYQSSTALVFPSEAEGFGYPVYEALSQGCVAICRQGLVDSSVEQVAGELLNYWGGEPSELCSIMQKACCDSISNEIRCGVAFQVRARLNFGEAVEAVFDSLSGLTA